MTVPAGIVDTRTGQSARVTPYGQLVVAPLAFSTPKRNEMTATATAYSFVRPSANQIIVLTDIIVSGGKDISANDPATVRVFAANGESSTIAATGEDTLQLLVGRGLTTAVTGLNVTVGGGVWLNATTDDATVSLTIAYYYAPVEQF